jgi:endonuclease III
MTDWMPGGRLPNASTEKGSFLFLVGVILNQNISGEMAWRGVARLSERTSLRPRHLMNTSVVDLTALIKIAPAVHPFAVAMSRAVVEAAELVCRECDGDARLLWRKAGSAEEAVVKLTTLRQVGRHKAEVAVFLLTSVYGELDSVPRIEIGRSCPALFAYLN